ncbi:MAG: GspE/PulE family protein [Methylocystaceae bacterium]
MKRKLLGDLLLEQDLITQTQLDDALNEQKTSREKLGTILVKKGIITELQLIETLEFVLGVPHVQLGKMNIDPEAVKLIPAQMARAHQVLPVSISNGILTLAMADPLNYQAIDDVRMYTRLDIVPVLASQRDMDTAIRQYMALKVDSRVEKLITELGQEDKKSVRQDDHLVEVEDDAPVIRMVTSLITQAVQGRASDIHIEPQDNDLRVRFRIDGVLYEVLRLPKKSVAPIISRAKIMADLDIAEKRLPQDGRCRMMVDRRQVDFRISTLPTVHGEKVVMRILDQTQALTTIDRLGFSSPNQRSLTNLAVKPHGLVLITGPTGSGKTTTLYSLLSLIDAAVKNVVTLEDPVEYSISGINQVQVNPRAGFTFASGLRSVLRQDPDVIMVGEIRDQETAQLAIQAALTGHLVLSTLHTNSAAATITRLADMGIEFYLLASALAGVISQRLVRRLCPNCRQSYLLDSTTAFRLGIDEETGSTFYRSVGCNMCRQVGYVGRAALQEVLILDDDLRNAITTGNTYEEAIERIATGNGMIPMRQDGIAKAREGITSLEEVIKVVTLGG